MSNWRSGGLPAACAAALVGAIAAHAATPGGHAGGSSATNASIQDIAPAAAANGSRVGHFKIGKAATPEQIAGWSIAVAPDGAGLPPGSGSVSQGEDIFATQCAACHGAFGEGAGRYPKLAGSGKLTDDQPVRTVGNYWPYATTLWDYINRAMPYPAPHSLSADEVYAVTAYVLNLNNLVPDDFVADKASVTAVRMPNRQGFLLRDPRPDTANSACMANCVGQADVRITGTTEGNTVTPRQTGPLDEMTPK